MEVPGLLCTFIYKCLFVGVLVCWGVGVFVCLFVCLFGVQVNWGWERKTKCSGKGDF